MKTRQNVICSQPSRPIRMKLLLAGFMSSSLLISSQYAQPVTLPHWPSYTPPPFHSSPSTLSPLQSPPPPHQLSSPPLTNSLNPLLFQLTPNLMPLNDRAIDPYRRKFHKYFATNSSTHRSLYISPRHGASDTAGTRSDTRAPAANH